MIGESANSSREAQISPQIASGSLHLKKIEPQCIFDSPPLFIRAQPSSRPYFWIINHHQK